MGSSRTLKETFLSKLTFRTILLLLIVFLGNLKYADAQGFSAYFGLGSATDSPGTSAGCPAKQLFDDFTGFCEAAPSMGGVFGVFGADFMVTPHLGVNGEYSFRFAQADYLPLAGLKFRTGFYDFNAVYHPLDVGRRIVPELQGGIGGAKISLYESATATVTGISATQSQFLASANHFQLHGAAGLKLYFKGNLFIKPQLDFRYIHNLNQQFGRNIVPEYTVAIGYSFGEH
jgi:hypothetical protein